MQHAPDKICQPASVSDLFWSFTKMAMQGFGGVAPVIQKEVVERKRWVTRDQFVEDWAVAQITPGPNVINLAVIIGSRYFGLAGALAALSGLVVAPTLLVIVLALCYSQVAEHPGVAGAMRAISAVVAGMFAATGLKLSTALLKNPLGLPLCLVLGTTCFVMVAMLRLPLIYALLGPGLVSWLLVYLKVRP